MSTPSACASPSNNPFNPTYCAADHASTAPVEIFLVLSNVALAFPAIACFRNGFHAIGFVLMLMALISFLYHLCSSYDYCLTHYQVLRLADHLFATSTVPVVFMVFLCFIHVFSVQLQFVLVAGSFVVNGLLMSYRDRIDVMTVSQFVFQPLYTLFIFLLAVALYLHKRALHMRLQKRLQADPFSALCVDEISLMGSLPPSVYEQLLTQLRSFNRLKFISGLAIGLFGFAVYLPSTDDRAVEAALHSVWHLCVSVGGYLVIDSLNCGQQAYLNDRIKEQHRQYFVEVPQNAWHTVRLGVRAAYDTAVDAMQRARAQRRSSSNSRRNKTFNLPLRK
jgi:hypothetical protein